MKTKCPLSRKERCEWCQAKSHVTPDCPNTQFLLDGSTDMTGMVCFVCGKEGHVNCGKPKREKKIYYCFKCGEKGHNGLECKSK